MDLSNIDFVNAVIPKRYEFVWDKNYIPFNIVRSVVKEFSDKDDVIFDPFGNSSLISIESSIFNSRKTISYFSDILALQRLKYTLLKNVDILSLENIFKNIKKNLEVQRFFIYETICPECGKHAIILSVLWKKDKIDSIKYECDECKSCDMKELDEFDLERIIEIEKFVFPYFAPENINRFFKKRNALALSSLHYAIEMLAEGTAEKIFKTIFFAFLYDIYEDIDKDEMMELNVFTYFELKFNAYISMLEDVKSFIEMFDESKLFCIDSFDDIVTFNPDHIFTIIPVSEVDSAMQDIFLGWFSSYRQELIRKKISENHLSIFVRSICLLKPDSKIIAFYHSKEQLLLYERELEHIPVKKFQEKEFITKDVRGRNHNCFVVIYTKEKE